MKFLVSIVMSVITIGVFAQRTGIGTTEPQESSILHLESADKALLLTRVANVSTIAVPIDGMIVYDESAGCFKVYQEGGWTGCLGSMNDDVLTPPLPDNVSLVSVSYHFIGSVHDTDYLPFVSPTDPASTNVVNANGLADPVVDYQGVITPDGITVYIPGTFTITGPVFFPAFSQTVNVPASLTEDGIARDLVLTFNAQVLYPGDLYVVAVIKAVDGDLNVKKLDINAGIGQDYLGLLLAEFSIPINNSGDFGMVQLRALPGIPDLRLGDGSGHDFLYMPLISVTGKMWLNNNLGANYNNINHPEFSLASQAESKTDHHAYGSFFQWGRYSDGHELVNWTGPATGTLVNGITTVMATTDTPGHSDFINPGVAPHDWRSNNNNNRWATSSNDPCPAGFRVPALSEIEDEFTAYSIISGSPDDMAYHSIHKYVQAGRFVGFFNGTGTSGYLWTRTIGTAGFGNASFVQIFSWQAVPSTSARDGGNPVRCIKE